MAEQKDDLGQTARPVQSRKPSQSGGVAEPLTASDRVTGDGSGSAAATGEKSSATVVRRKNQ